MFFNNKSIFFCLSAQSSTRRPNLPALPRVISNGSDLSNSSSNRLASAGDAIRRVSSTGKFNQANIQTVPGPGIQRQTSTVSIYIYIFKDD